MPSQKSLIGDGGGGEDATVEVSLGGHNYLKPHPSPLIIFFETLVSNTVHFPTLVPTRHASGNSNS